MVKSSVMTTPSQGEALINRLASGLKEYSDYMPIIIFAKGSEIKNRELFHLNGYFELCSVSDDIKKLIDDFHNALDEIYPNVKPKSIRGFNERQTLFDYYPLNGKRKMTLFGTLGEDRFGDNKFLTDNIRNAIKEATEIFISK